jgi:hypothetical protein
MLIVNNQHRGKQNHHKLPVHQVLQHEVYHLQNLFINVARGVVNQAIQQIPHQQTGTGLSSSSSHIILNHMNNKDLSSTYIKEKCKLIVSY